MTKSQTDRDTWKDALRYIVRYEVRGSYRYERVLRTKKIIDEMLLLGSFGELTEERFLEMRNALDVDEHRIARDAWTTNVHAFVHTKEWIDRLADSLAGKTVLEIGASRGTLMQPMNSRGVQWIGVQINPDKDCRFKPIPVIDYIDAIQGYKNTIDYIFVAWPAYTMRNTNFMQIVYEAKRLDIPVLLVSERRVITSTSGELWDRQSLDGYRLVQAREFAPARWRGVHDHLWVIVDEIHLKSDGDRSKLLI